LAEQELQPQSIIRLTHKVNWYSPDEFPGVGVKLEIFWIAGKPPAAASAGFLQLVASKLAAARGARARLVASARGRKRSEISLAEILQMNPKPASIFAFSRPSCKTDARC
jgi:hypothetical protein